jgi:hypothetical protein
MGYIHKLAENIHQRRGKRHAPGRSDSTLEGEFWVGERSVYYDTHPLEGDLEGTGAGRFGAIHERQKESLFNCGQCPGLLLIQTRSQVSVPSAHYRLPRDPCPKCLALADSLGPADRTD